jgi:hypothetical protein
MGLTVKDTQAGPTAVRPLESMHGQGDDEEAGASDEDDISDGDVRCRSMANHVLIYWYSLLLNYALQFTSGATF